MTAAPSLRLRSARRTAGLALALLSGLAVTASAKDAPAAESVPIASSKACLSGFDTRTNPVTPPSTSAYGNPAIAAVKMKKSCTGAVAVRFETEIQTPNSLDGISVVVVAKCVKPAGYANGCTKGDLVSGQPGLIVLYDEDVGTFGSHGALWVYKSMKPGLWRFEVRAQNGTSAKVINRVMEVDAYSGG